MTDPRPAPTDDFSHSLRRGTRAVLAAQTASQIISLATLGFLFRQLGPEPFGLIGMVMPALVLARMIAGFGLQESVVQAESLDAAARNRAFWMSLSMSFLAMLLMLLASPSLAMLFETPRLTVVGAALAGTLPLSALGTIHQGIWQRRMAIAALAKVRVIAQLAGAATACALAWTGLGVWALVAQPWTELSMLAALLWLGSDWRPRWRGLSVQRDLMRFGGWYTAASLCFYWAQNVDKYLLAALLGSSVPGRVALGMYYQAYNLALKPVHLVTTPATSIALPALSRLRNRAAGFAEFSRELLFVLFAILAPAATGMALLSTDIMWVMGGGRWLSAAPMLLAFTPLVATQGLINVCGSVFASRGNARQLCFGAAVQAVALTGGCLVAFYGTQKLQWTPQVSAVSMALAVGVTTSVVVAGPYLAYCARLHALRPLATFGSWLRVAGSCAVMAVAVNAYRTLVTEQVHPAFTLFTSTAIGIVAYALLMFSTLRKTWSRWRTGKEI